MELDDDICLCFHVSKRKVVNFLRVEQPSRVGQLADCFGAGTGCGWCRPFLRQLFQEAQVGEVDPRGCPRRPNTRSESRLFGGGGRTPPPASAPQ